MWEMVNNRQLIVGAGKTGDIPSLLQWHGLKKVFFAIYDAKASVCERLCKALTEQDINYVLYDAVLGEPDLHSINKGRDLYVASGCDCTLAVGGGSVIDAAKAVNMLAANGGMVEEYQMDGRPVTTEPALFIAVPTTAGTGAEATKVSVVFNNHNGLKKSLYHTSMIADIAILDAELTVDLPPHVTAATGMDALSHGIESYVSLNATPLSKMYSLKAIELVYRYLPLACSEPKSISARENMLLASYFGGCAISAGIGIAHIMAQPVGAMYKVPHGDACSIFLPLAMEFNLDHAAAHYAKIAETLGVAEPGTHDREKGLAAIAAIRRLREAIGAPVRLAPYCKEAPDLSFVVETVQKTTGHITCNPRPIDQAVFKEMFTLAM